MVDQRANVAIPGRWLRHKEDGTIYGYTALLAKNSKVEEVPEELAFPERFIPKKQRKRKSKVAKKLKTSDKDIKAAEAPDMDNPEVNADASKGLPA